MTDKVLTVLLLVGGLWLWLKNKPAANIQSSPTQVPGGQVSPVNYDAGTPVMVPTVSVGGAPEQVVVPITEAPYYTVQGRYISYRPATNCFPERAIPLSAGGMCTV